MFESVYLSCYFDIFEILSLHCIFFLCRTKNKKIPVFMQERILNCNLLVRIITSSCFSVYLTYIIDSTHVKVSYLLLTFLCRGINSYSRFGKSFTFSATYKWWICEGCFRNSRLFDWNLDRNLISNIRIECLIY